MGVAGTGGTDPWEGVVGVPVISMVRVFMASTCDGLVDVVWFIFCVPFGSGIANSIVSQTSILQLYCVSEIRN